MEIMLEKEDVRGGKYQKKDDREREDIRRRGC